MADNMKDNPDAHCLPIGYMQLHLHPQPHKIVQTEDLIVMIWESNGGLRQVFLDGRELPEDDPQVRQPDITKARTILGWEPKVDLEDGLRRTLAYFRERMDLVEAAG